jgi:hypothetical protein
MKRWPWGLLAGVSATLTGCEQPSAARLPVPEIDTVAPAAVETATFALG